MPEQKKNEMTDSDRFKSLYFDSSQENLLLKGGRTHRLSIGGVTLEIVPSSKMSPKQVFNMYIKFLKELKEFLKLDDKIIFKKRIKAKQNSLKYSLYRHFCRLLMILESD